MNNSYRNEVLSGTPSKAKAERGGVDYRGYVRKEGNETKQKKTRDDNSLYIYTTT